MKILEKSDIKLRKWYEELHNVKGVYIIPDGRKDKNDDGYGYMSFVAEFVEDNKPLVRFGKDCNTISLNGNNFKIDCTFPENIIHIWNGDLWKKRAFCITEDFSLIYFKEK